ncbi:MAG: methyltransferase domain-containing protein [Clostridia bacterium]|nr:methyltransferase domain-containing protein [Clostridia bacterium]
MELNGLICPVCGAPLSRNEGKNALCCAGTVSKKHNFDISRAGHVNFAGGAYDPNSGDPADMVRSRIAFLEKGHYAPLVSRIAGIIAERGGICVDAGCGSGYYTQLFSEGADITYGFDLSKTAVEYAAKKAKREGKRCFYGVSSVYSLPIADGAASAVTSVFAPVAEAEFARVLKDGGRLIIAAAAPDHLCDMKAMLYDTVTENGERGDLPQNMALEFRERLTYKRTLENADIAALYGMTPYSRRTSKEAAERLLSLDRLEITFSFDIFVYAKKEQK